jgi:hypothetical protein
MWNLSRKIGLIFGLYLGLSLPSYANNWRLDKDDNGIKIYTRAIQGSDIREVKSEILIDATLDNVLAVFDDISSYPHWHHKNTKANLLIKRGASERYHYQNFTMPFPVSDRDIVIHSQIIRVGKGVKITSNAASTFCDNASIEACTAITKSKNIMITRLKGTHLLTSQKGGGVKLVWQQHAEPAGKIPKWLVNQLLLDVPYTTLENLRKQVKLKKYQDAMYVKD